jgi:hypothetical protein
MFHVKPVGDGLALGPTSVDFVTSGLGSEYSGIVGMSLAKSASARSNSARRFAGSGVRLVSVSRFVATRLQ